MFVFRLLCQAHDNEFIGLDSPIRPRVLSILRKIKSGMPAQTVAALLGNIKPDGLKKRAKEIMDSLVATAPAAPAAGGNA